MKKRITSYIVNFVAAAIIFFVMFNMIETKVISRYWSGIVLMVGINIIMATSLNLTTGFLGQLALGHAGFMAVGAYASALFTKNMPWDLSISFPVSLLLAGIVAAIFGIIIGVPALRLQGDYLAIITLGFGEIIRVLINNMEFTGGAKGLTGIKGLTTFPYVYVIALIVIIFMFTWGRSRHGRAALSIREDAVAAEASGIPTTYYKILAFTLAAFFAGIAGGLYAHYARVLDPKTFNFNKSIEYLVMVVLGGMGSISGSIIAATVLTLLPELLRGFSEYRMLIYSLVLILMMLFRPKGLMGTSEFSLTDLFFRAFGLTRKKAKKPDAIQ